MKNIFYIRDTNDSILFWIAWLELRPSACPSQRLPNVSASIYSTFGQANQISVCISSVSSIFHINLRSDVFNFHTSASNNRMMKQHTDVIKICSLRFKHLLIWPIFNEREFSDWCRRKLSVYLLCNNRLLSAANEHQGNWIRQTGRSVVTCTIRSINAYKNI